MRSHSLSYSVALILGGLTAASSAQAQRSSDDDWLEDCRHSERGRRVPFCEVREQRLPATGRAVRVDARENGGVSVIGWEGNEIVVHARVQTRARSDRDARDIAR